MLVFFHHIISKLVADFALIKISLQDDCKMLVFLENPKIFSFFHHYYTALT